MENWEHVREVAAALRADVDKTRSDVDRVSQTLTLLTKMINGNGNGNGDNEDDSSDETSDVR